MLSIKQGSNSTIKTSANQRTVIMEVPALVIAALDELAPLVAVNFADEPLEEAHLLAWKEKITVGLATAKRVLRGGGDPILQGRQMEMLMYFKRGVCNIWLSEVHDNKGNRSLFIDSLRAAVKDLEDAGKLARFPEESAHMLMMKLTALNNMGAGDEAIRVARELRAALQDSRDDRPDPNPANDDGPTLLTHPEIRAKCADVIANADSIWVEMRHLEKATQAERGRALYSSACDLLQEGRYAEAAEAARESVRLLPDATEGYAVLGKALEGAGDHREACIVYMNALKRGEGKNHNSLIPALEAANAVARLFSDDFFVSAVCGGLKCNACGASERDTALTRCSSCKIARYCCRQHQRDRWAVHKPVCRALKEMQKDAIDAQQWLEAKGYGGLYPPMLHQKTPVHSLETLKSWDDFDRHFQIVPCSPPGLIRHQKDRLSPVLTLLAALCRFGLEQSPSPLCVHVLGADDKNDWECFSSSGSCQLLQLLPIPGNDLSIVLVGPELSAHETIVIDLPPRPQSAAAGHISRKHCAHLVCHGTLSQRPRRAQQQQQQHQQLPVPDNYSRSSSPDMCIFMHPGLCEGDLLLDSHPGDPCRSAMRVYFLQPR